MPSAASCSSGCSTGRNRVAFWSHPSARPDAGRSERWSTWWGQGIAGHARGAGGHHRDLRCRGPRGVRRRRGNRADVASSSIRDGRSRCIRPRPRCDRDDLRRRSRACPCASPSRTITQSASPRVMTVALPERSAFAGDSRLAARTTEEPVVRPGVDHRARHRGKNDGSATDGDRLTSARRRAGAAPRDGENQTPAQPGSVWPDGIPHRDLHKRPTARRRYVELELLGPLNLAPRQSAALTSRYTLHARARRAQWERQPTASRACREPLGELGAHRKLRAADAKAGVLAVVRTADVTMALFTSVRRKRALGGRVIPIGGYQ